MRHKKPWSQIEPRRVRRQAAHSFQRSIQCKPLHSPRNSFFSVGAPGFLFIVTVHQGPYSLSVPLSSSLTVMALELEASVEMLPKVDKELHESETSPKLSTYSTVSYTRLVCFVAFRGGAICVGGAGRLTGVCGLDRAARAAKATTTATAPTTAAPTAPTATAIAGARRATRLLFCILFRSHKGTHRQSSQGRSTTLCEAIYTTSP